MRLTDRGWVELAVCTGRYGAGGLSEDAEVYHGLGEELHLEAGGRGQYWL